MYTALHYTALHYLANISMPYIKLDVVGPVDNRPSTDKLHHFVKKKN